MAEITIPVLVNFDETRVVGSMTLDTDKLPPSANFCVSFGSMTTHSPPCYQLICASLIQDRAYYEYLQQQYEDQP